MAAQQRIQQRLRLLQLLHRSPGTKESSGRQQDHGTIDGPSHNHGEQRIIEFIFQYFTNGALVLLVVLVALYHL